jgi:hypothetical protein
MGEDIDEDVAMGARPYQAVITRTYKKATNK